MKQIFTFILLCLALVEISAQCSISNVVAEPYECDENDMFLVDVDFDFSETSDTFEIRGNGVSYGFFGYDELPVTIGPLLGDCETEYEVVVRDNQTPDCNTAVALGLICCGNTCNLSEMTAQVDCDGVDNTSVFIDFIQQGAGTEFSLSGNGMNYGDFLYSSLPISVEVPADCSTNYEFVATDAENMACSVFIEIGEICCNSCEIGELDVNLTTCNDQGEFFAEIDFEYNDPESAMFTVVGNGMNYGNFEYTALPITVGPMIGDCMTEYELIVYDSEEETCSSDFEIGTVCCAIPDCDLSELIATVDCDIDSTFGVFIDFDYTGTSDSFEVRGNGNNYGTFSYTDLPIFIAELAADCETNYELVIVDQDQENCNVSTGLGVVCCDGDMCDFGELVVEVSNCSSDESFFINIELIDPEVTIVNISVDGVVYDEIHVDDFPVTLGPYPGDCESLFTIDLVDVMNPDCTETVVVEAACCTTEECLLGELIVEYTCDGEELIYVDLDLASYEGDGGTFTVLGNGNTYGSYNYNSLPITLGPLAVNCDLEYEFIISDNVSDDCMAVAEVGQICCSADPCELGEMTAEYECTSFELFDIAIDFDYFGVVSDSFRVVGNGNQYGTYAYSQLPITLLDLEVDCDLEYEFIAIDLLDENCSTAIGFEEICCMEEECVIDNVQVEHECTNEEYFNLFVDFESSNTTSDSFQIVGNGVQYGIFGYNELPISIIELIVNCDQEYEFIVFDIEDENCSSVVEYGKICCVMEGCSIDIIDVDMIECKDEEISMSVNFEFEEAGIGYDVSINEVFFGFFNYDEVPLQIEGYESDSEEIVIEICANDNADCCDEISIMNPCLVDAVDDLESTRFTWNYHAESGLLSNVSDDRLEFTILSVNGTVLDHDFVGAYAQKYISMSDLSSGMYFVQLRQKDAYKVVKFTVTR